ncbi:MAG: 6-bladed beta-propeller [Phycisphaerae bacterium]|nr:6-bladed beta-propeller [Phycisphaerae bacterium]
MNAKKLFIVIALLGVFTGNIEAEEKYHTVKIWPEAPQGWHFFQPRGIAVDQSDNVYVGDSGNYKVKKFDAEGRFITQWGNPGQKDGQFSSIHIIEVGRSGTIYVVDEESRSKTMTVRRIQTFTPHGQFLGLLERTAPGAAETALPIDIAEDGNGNIYVLAVDYVKKDRRVQRTAVEKYSPNMEFIAQWQMDAGSGDGQFQHPTAIDLDARGNFYVVEYTNACVQKFDRSGKFLMKWGAHGQGEGALSGPHSIVVDKSGEVYVRDRDGVQKFTPTGEFLARWKMKIEVVSRGMALDSDSNIYVTNRGSHAVLKLDKTGKVISQWGCAGAGDGSFSWPGSIAVDSSGNAVVADFDNNRIQRFDSNGNFLSQCGSEAWLSLSDLATDASGNLYVACGGSDEVQKYDPHGKLIDRWGSTGSGDGQFSYPSAIAVGPSDNVYVVDMTNNRVQKFTKDGKFFAKWGTRGAGDGQFDGPFFIAVDDSGNVWVADQLGGGKHRMQKFDANGRFLAQWTKRIMIPRGARGVGAMAVDSSGSSFYAFENRIEKYDIQGDLVTAYGREGLKDDRLRRVCGMGFDKAGHLYVTSLADPCEFHLSTGGSIRKYEATGQLVSKWTGENVGEKDGIPNGPITVDRAGNIYTSYLGGIPIWKLSSDGRLLSKFQIEPPLRESGFNLLGGVAVDKTGNVYAVDSIDVDWHYYGIPSIKKFDSKGDFITTWGVPEEAEGKFKYPARIAVDGSGHTYVTDHSSHCIHKLDDRGKYIKSWGGKGTGDGQFDTPEGIAVDKSGNVYVCDRQNSRIQKFDPNGRFLTKWGKQGSGEGEFHFPAAIALDKKNNVYVADSNNNRIQKFTPDGNFLTEWGEFGEAPGQFNVPLGIAVDALGNVYVSDSHNHRIQKFASANP